MMIRHYHDRSAIFFAFLVESNLLHARWTERFRNEPRRVLIPLNDVNLLALELVDDLANTRPSRANTRANRIDIVIVGGNCDLGPMSRFSRNGLDLDVTIDQLRNLKLKERSDELWMAPRHNDLWALAFTANFENPGLHPISTL